MDDCEPSEFGFWLKILPPLICAAVIAWLAHGVILGGHPLRVAGLVLLVGGVAGLAGWLVGGTGRMPARLASLAVWFVPVAGLVARRGPGGFASVVAISVATAVLWLDIRRRLQMETQHSGEDGLLIRPMVLSAAAAASICGTIGWLTSPSFTGAVAALLIVGASCFVVTLFALRGMFLVGRETSGRPILNTLAAIVFSFLALGSMRSGSVMGSNPSAGRRSATGLISGAILLHVNKDAKMRAPIARVSPLRSWAQERADKFIPFSGEYWFFYAPRRRPPEDALVERGTPLEFNFTSTGRQTVVMQARQRLGEPIPLSCCRHLVLSVSNADRQSQAVTVEVVLTDPRLQKHNRVSLGIQKVSGWGYSRLMFDFPPRAQLQAFEEIVVWFHLDAPRAQRSASMAVDGFELTP